MGVMSEAELHQAIEEPARLGGWELETGLVGQMLSDIAPIATNNGAGGAPLLSHALLETWNKRKGRRLTLAGYQETGGVRGSIAHSADQVYKGLKPGEQEIARIFSCA